jgi:hypothetical protein
MEIIMKTLTVSTKDLVEIIAGVLDDYSLLKDLPEHKLEALCLALQLSIDHCVKE